MAEALLAAGADRAAVNADGDTPFLLSCFSGRIELCQLFASRGEPLEQTNTSQCSGLLQACAAGHLELVQWLLPKAPALRDTPDEAGRTPLEHCCVHGHAEVAEWLLLQGAAPTQEAAKVAKGYPRVSKLIKQALKERGRGDEPAGPRKR